MKYFRLYLFISIITLISCKQKSGNDNIIGSWQLVYPEEREKMAERVKSFGGDVPKAVYTFNSDSSYTNQWIAGGKVDETESEAGKFSIQNNGKTLVVTTTDAGGGLQNQVMDIISITSSKMIVQNTEG
ncbi:MAG: hypothetical protein EOO88_59315, partial [Pedobacter sp.]